MSTPKKISEFFPSLVKPQVLNNQEQVINTTCNIINSMSNAAISIDNTDNSAYLRSANIGFNSFDISKSKKLILIPKNLATNISYDKNLRKAVSIYLYLKFQSTSGAIPLNKDIAPLLFCSYPTALKHISKLQSMGLITIKNKTIFCCSWSIFSKEFLLPRKLNFYYLPNDKNIQKRLIYLAGKESLKAQKSAIRIKKSKTILYAKVTNEALRNDLKLDFIYRKQSAYINLKINPIVTLSRQGYANKLGLSHRTSSAYYIKMFERMNWIIDEPGEIIQSNQRARSSQLTKSGVKWSNRKKATFLRTPNKLSFLPHV